MEICQRSIFHAFTLKKSESGYKGNTKKNPCKLFLIIFLIFPSKKRDFIREGIPNLQKKIGDKG
jgi:hypothetical protein